jgi:octopine/nopaline transport system permease protein
MSYFELMSFGPAGWGWAMVRAAGMTLLVAALGFGVGALIGSLVAWAKLSRSLIARTFADGYTTVLRGIPDLLVIYLFYFGGSAALGSVAACSAIRASSACRRSSPAPSPSASCPAPTRPKSFAEPTPP